MILLDHWTYYFNLLLILPVRTYFISVVVIQSRAEVGSKKLSGCCLGFPEEESELLRQFGPQEQFFLCLNLCFLFLELVGLLK